MADPITEIISETVENITENANKTGKIPATPEGMAVAYSSLVIMAILPIFFGSLRSISHHKEQQKQFKVSGEKPDTMSQKEAVMFPVVASMTLFGLYIFFQIFSKEYINLLLTVYFFFLGILALCHIASPVVNSLVPSSIPKFQYHIKFTENDKDIVNYKFNTHDIVCLCCCTLVGTWYIMKKHWIANNLLGIAFAINGVEILHLNNVVTGCILLMGLFVYDVFWVFGTNVMVMVANSFDAPIKLVFPQDLLEKGLAGQNFAMLGLGDIVIPGIFIALLLRFDRSLKRKSDTYFYTTFFAYFLGLITTMVIMHLFNHAQPALLYLVPACLGTPLFLALVKGDLTTLFAYEDHPSGKKESSVEKLDKETRTMSSKKEK